MSASTAARPKTYDSKIGAVTVPEDHEDEPKKATPEAEETTHEEIQWLLLKLGSAGPRRLGGQKRQEQDA